MSWESSESDLLLARKDFWILPMLCSMSVPREKRCPFEHTHLKMSWIQHQIKKKEICGSDCFRHLPPMLGDGKSVDLFKLYVKVRERGGYESVLKSGLWDSVAKEWGLTSDVGSAVKLVYLKYLDILDI